MRTTDKVRRQRERALEPLPVALPTEAVELLPALALEQAPALEQALALDLARLREVVLQDLNRALAERANVLMDRAVLQAVLAQAPTIRRRGGKLPAPAGPARTRRS